jgi:hypothetical protein
MLTIGIYYTLLTMTNLIRATGRILRTEDVHEAKLGRGIIRAINGRAQIAIFVITLAGNVSDSSIQ